MIRYLAAFLAIILLIVVHELGHYIAGRALGATLTEYAIGFGPRLVTHTSKKTGIAYSLRAVPLGGFCAFSDDKDDPHMISNLKKWKRIIIYLAGPVMNFITASVVTLVLFACVGLPVKTNYIDAVKPAFNATASLEAGDEITAVNGTAVKSTAEFDEQTADIDSSDPVKLTVKRADTGKTEDITVMPYNVQNSGVYDLGFIRKTVNHRTSISVALMESVIFPAGMIVDTVKGLASIFQPHGLSQVSSIVSVVSIVGDYARISQLPYFLMYVIIIAVSLGVMNLLPIPGLDGSKIIFRLGEAIAHKDMPEKVEYRITVASLTILMGLGIILVGRDLQNVLIGLVK